MTGTATGDPSARTDPVYRSCPSFPPWRFMLAVDDVNYDLDELTRMRRCHPELPVLNLASGVNFGRPPERLVEFVVRLAADARWWHDYDGPQGHVVGRAAIAACENARGSGRAALGVDNVLVTAGASAALTLVAHALAADAGGGPVEAILPVPTFPLVGACLDAAGYRIVQVAAETAIPRLPGVGEMTARAGPHTRLVYVNTFNNPTGEHYDAAALRRLLRWARRRDVVILHDTVSSDVSAGSRLPHLPSLAADEAYLHGLVTVGSLSKTRALPGFRVGWLIADASLIDRLGRANELNAPSSPSIATPALLLDRLVTAATETADADGPADRTERAWQAFNRLVDPYSDAVPGLADLLAITRHEIVDAGAAAELVRWRSALRHTLATNVDVLTRDHRDLVAEVPPWNGDFNTFLRLPALDGRDHLTTTHRLFREFGLQTLPAPVFGFDEPWWRRRGYYTRLSFALPTGLWTAGLSRLRAAVHQLGRRR